MINHARTLLLNSRASARPALGTFGEEYVPSDYVGLVLGPSLSSIHANLFGTSPQAVFENAMLAQYMTALHSVDEADRFILGLDPRVTYKTDGYVAPGASVQVSDVSGSGELLHSGVLLSDPLAGTLDYQLEVIRASGRVQVRSGDTLLSRRGNTVDFRGLTLRATGDGAWRVAARSGVDYTIPDVVAELEKNQDVNALCQRGSVTFQSWWTRGQTPVVRICGVLCSFVKIMDEAYGR